MSILSLVKGALGELQGRAARKFFLDEKVYRSLHNDPREGRHDAD
jgi:hypothetical protein